MPRKCPKGEEDLNRGAPLSTPACTCEQCHIDTFVFNYFLVYDRGDDGSGNNGDSSSDKCINNICADKLMMND